MILAGRKNGGLAIGPAGPPPAAQWQQSPPSRQVVGCWRTHGPAGGSILEGRQLPDTPSSVPYLFLDRLNLAEPLLCRCHRATNSARTKSSRPSGQAAWARSTALTGESDTASSSPASRPTISPFRRNKRAGSGKRVRRLDTNR